MVKRAQSALEYMMTYGWAILIIVIVAAVLYSMGIFNPSSSVTTSSSGFSPFTVSAALCNSSGTWVSFVVGGYPNGAQSATSVTLTLTATSGASGSGTATAIGSPTYTSGTSFKMTAAGVTCATAGGKFSESGSIGYSVTTTLGAQSYTTTGTVAGSAS